MSKNHLSQVLNSVSTLSLTMALMSSFLSAPSWAMIENDLSHIKVKQEPGLDIIDGGRLPLVNIKQEPGPEISLATKKKVFTIQKISRDLHRINPHFDPETERGIELCLPCNIILYKWILSGSEYPEEVDLYAKRQFEHLVPIDGVRSLLQDPLLDKLSLQTIFEEDKDGGLRVIHCLPSDLPPSFLPVLLAGLKEKIGREPGNVKYNLRLLTKPPRPEDIKPTEVAVFSEDDKIYYQFNTGQNKKERFEIHWNLFPEHQESFSRILNALKGDRTIDVTEDDKTRLLDFTLWHSNTRNVPWHQYEDSGETFKTGMLYLPHRDNETEAHLLLFHYYKQKILKKKSKKDKTFGFSKKNKNKTNKKQDRYALYILDGAENKWFTFEKFLEEYEDSYADHIKIWYGQNNINYACNRSVKEMFEDLKKEASNDALSQTHDLQSIVLEEAQEISMTKSVFEKRNTTLKFTLKRPSSSEEEEETVLLKKQKLANLFDMLSNDEFGELTNLTPFELPVNREKNTEIKKNPWDKFAASVAFLKFQNRSEDEENQIHEREQEVNIQPSRMPRTSSGLPTQDFNLSEPSSFEEEDSFESVTEIETENNCGYSIEKILENPSKEGYFDQSFIIEPAMSIQAHHPKTVHKINDSNFDFYKPIADQGDTNAQSHVGHIYYKEGKFEEAFKYLKPAADQGNTEAQVILGSMYFTGNGVPKDLDKAFYFFTLGNGVFPYFRETMEKSEVETTDKNLKFLNVPQYIPYIPQNVQHNQVGQYSINNQPITNDLLTYNKVIINTFSASNPLSKVYVDESFPDPGFHYLKKSADQGDANAQYFVGFKYYRENNLEEALKYWQPAAVQGHANAQAILGCMHSAGRGGPKDLDKAFYFFTLSANQGHATAQCILGCMHANGIGIPKDLKKAFNYFARSANKGNAYAQEMLEPLKKREGTLDTNLKFLNVPQHIPYIPQNVQHNQAGQYSLNNQQIKNDIITRDIALSYLGDMFYKRGKFEETFKYLKPAADNGDEEAQYFLDKIFSWQRFWIRL
jgi:TPR repeat protein